jgi:hypothetical protein
LPATQRATSRAISASDLAIVKVEGAHLSLVHVDHHSLEIDAPRRQPARQPFNRHITAPVQAHLEVASPQAKPLLVGGKQALALSLCGARLPAPGAAAIVGPPRGRVSRA